MGDLAQATGNVFRGKGFKTREQIRMEKAGEITSQKNKIFASAGAPPDEVEIARTERRRAARRRGSRAQTVLSGGDRLGPAG